MKFTWVWLISMTIALTPIASCRLLEPLGWKTSPAVQLKLRLQQSYTRKRSVHGFDLDFEHQKPDAIVVRVNYSPQKTPLHQVRLVAEGATEMAKKLALEEFGLRDLKTEIIYQEVELP